tara:strand:- start:44385 stop:44573 length:189 start_codon:yes stop_codon:yes gene_type:complete
MKTFILKLGEYVNLFISYLDRTLQDVLGLAERFVALGVRMAIFYGLYKLAWGGLLEELIAAL